MVTGGTSGIGLAIAKSLADAGAQVAINGLGTPEQIDAALAHVKAGGSPVRYVAADLCKPGEITAMMQAVQAWCEIDILVNCAGVQHAAPLPEQPAHIWDRILALNLSAAFHTMQQALPGMAARGYGRVINIASVHGLVASKDKTPYVTSKFGLVGLSKVAVLEYAAVGSRDDGIRDDGIRALLEEKQPSQRLSQPEDISAGVWHRLGNFLSKLCPVRGAEQSRPGAFWGRASGLRG